MEISLLGPLQVRGADGSLIDLGGARLRALLIRLALDTDRIVGAPALVDAVWGDEPPGNAADALQALVSRLRRTGLPVEGHQTGYRLALPLDAVDVHRFEALIAAREPDPALRLWRGEALADVADAEFARAPVARLTELRLTATEDRLAQLIEDGRIDVAEIEELVVAHPLRERPVHLLMRALAGQGRRAEALSAYDRYRSLVADQLGSDPSASLAELHLGILRQDAVPLAPHRTNLRASRTSFLGREYDLLKVAELVAGSRLTTLTGPGGSGKTRLAVESARHALDAYADGVWLVELAPITDATELPQAVLGVLGAREVKLRADPLAAEPHDPLDRLVAALRHKQVLLLLDNCEHVIDAAAALADQLLGDCPRLRVLATSREPLSVPGEALWPVEPLHLAEAVRLLDERARAVRPGFTVDDDTRPHVVEICRALDGMPLAIELAAARLRTMTPAQLASRLDDRFRLLRGGSRTALPRHQTLRAVIDWSWDLLDRQERAVWQRLALCTGGATLEAAAAICGGDVLDLVTALADKSLCRPDADRYRMLETIREYGLERLAESGEEADARRAWAEYYVELAARAEPLLRTPAQLHWLDVFQAEHDNMQAVLRWAISHGHTLIAYRMVAGAGWFWWLRGYRSEGAQAVREVLELPGAVPPGLRALVYLIGAIVAMEVNADFVQAQQWLTMACELSGEANDPHPMLRLATPMRALMDTGLHGMGEVLGVLTAYFDDADPWVAAIARAFHGHALLNVGRDVDTAREDFTVALDGFRVLGDRWGMGLVLDALSTLAAQTGDFPASARYAGEAIELIAPLGTKDDQVQLRLRLAWAQWQLGRHEEAEATVAAAERIADRLGLPSVIAHAEYAAANLARLGGRMAVARKRMRHAYEILDAATVAPQFRAMINDGLGLIAAADGDVAAAAHWHGEAVDQAVSSGDAPIVGMTLVGRASLAVRVGDGELAAALLGASDSIVGVVDRSNVDRPAIEAAAKAVLGEDGFAAAYRRGCAYTLKTVTELVRPAAGTG